MYLLNARIVEKGSLPVTVPCLFYGNNGQPLNEDTRRRWQERKEYVEKVASSEVSKQIDNKLSTTLDNHGPQNLAYAVRVYLDHGKLGFYDKVLETFESNYVR